MDKYTQKLISTIPEQHLGKRVDYFLSDVLDDLSRSQIKRYIKGGNILINGESFKPSRILLGNETIKINIPQPQPSTLIPQDMGLDVIYEDTDMVVINKPAGLTVHPGAGIKQGTLVNGLLYLCRDLSGIGGEVRPGIVHRLDKETSGVMVATKNDFSHINLVNQFKKREVHKKYVTIVIGEIKQLSGTYRSFIGRNKNNRLKMSSIQSGGREAVTNWKVIKRYSHFTYLTVEPETGRTHQIRVHFSENSFPILGDKLYTYKNSKNSVLNILNKKISRHALHAAELSFKHPRSGETVIFKADIPDDMKGVIDYLEKLI